jgi:type IV secretory pathway TrbD component
MEPRSNPAFRALNVPRTVFGVDQRLFFICIAGAYFVFATGNTIVGGLGTFVGLIVALRRVSRIDPRILDVIPKASRLKTRYDAGKAKPVEVVLC